MKPLTTIETLPERLLQRGVQRVFGDPSRLWTATNGEQFHVVAAGTQNVHEGPDFVNMAILHRGSVLVGDAEFHVKTSEWQAHQHSLDSRYDDLMLHVVFDDNIARHDVARWTVILSRDEVERHVYRRRQESISDVDELQHFALLRLLRNTAHAHALTRRIGSMGAFAAGIAEFVDRLKAKRRRPSEAISVHEIVSKAETSPMAAIIRTLPHIQPSDLLNRIETAELSAIAHEGLYMRRELFVNALLPLLCVQATLEQRVVLFQWYWSAPSPHSYGMLRRRFPSQPQERVWQQQGMLEFLREHGGRTGVCGEIIRRYGLHNTIEFLQASPLP